MGLFEWRKFNFFDLKSAGDENTLSILGETEITSYCSGNNQIIICDSDGLVHLFRKNWEYLCYKAHDSQITQCQIAIQNNLLITIGFHDEEGAPIPEFKIWNLSKVNKEVPALLRTVKTPLQKPTALGVSEGGQYMAIGFDRGNVTFYKGDIARDRTKTLKTLTFGTAAIRGIEFKHSGKNTLMFICSDSGVYLYTIQGRDKEFKSVLDNVASPTTCCALQTGHNEGHFMVGRDDAIYCYTADGRGPCYALEGRKLLVRWFRSHLLVVSSPIRENSPTAKTCTLTVIDIVNKFIVFTIQLDSIISIFIEFGTCYLITSNKQLFHLDEKDLQSKLNLLFKKNLYDTAVKIAKNNQYDEEGLADIFKQYGDHLYNKGNFAGAVDQYIKTIGYLEPSYVIRRFLDSRHTQYLTDYLESLHSKKKASADHTTLLLNCFTRLDRTNELKIFLDNYKQDNLLFDIDVAIKVCRKSCIDEALELAKINQKHDYAISILIEDMKLYEKSLDYIAELSYADAEKNLKKFGNLLMEHCGQKTIELLKKLCSDFLQLEQKDEDIFDVEEFKMGSPEDFMHLFNDSLQLIDYIEYMIKTLVKCNQGVYNTLIEHYLTLWHCKEIAPEAKRTYEQRLLDLITNCEENFDKNHVLVLCQTYQFWMGVMLIYEELKLYHLIVRHYLKTKDYSKLCLLCKRLGSSDPTIWLHALNGLKIDNQIPPAFLMETLQVIAHEKLLSPLQVLEILTSVEDGPNLLSVRSYLMQTFQKENDAMHQEESLTVKYRDETGAIKRQIYGLENETQEFRATLCDTCRQPLHLPALYFLCKHSFHQECLHSFSETEKDCPICVKQNNNLLDIIHKQNESHNKHHIFQSLLSESNEPFSIVADYFGKGFFNKIVIYNEDEDRKDLMEERLEIARKNQAKLQEQVKVVPLNYGPGIEAKIRIEEGQRHHIEPILPQSEARLRLQEQKHTPKVREVASKVSRPLAIAAPSQGVVKLKPAPVQVKPAPVQVKPMPVPIKQTQAPTYPKNPFDDEDDEAVEATPNPKNPFEENDEDDYDKSLNPFE